jgi:hypothetical protein
MKNSRKMAKTDGERAGQPALHPFSPFNPKKRTSSGEKRRSMFVFSGFFMFVTLW